MQLYIMRHGETSWNKARMIQGRTDTELTERGIEMAEKTAEGMKNIDFECIYSSPLTRAYKTAEVIRAGRDIPIIKDERLFEVCFGEWEGANIDERQDQLEKFFDDPVKYVATRGAESYEDILSRAKSFLEEVIYPLKDKEDDCKVLVAGHAAINRGLSAILMNTELKDFWAEPHRKNCAVDIYEITKEGIKAIQEAGYYY